MLAERAVVDRHPHPVQRVGAGLHLIDQVTNGQGMRLGYTEDDGLLALVDHLHQGLDPVGLTLLDLDDLVEFLFLVTLALLDVAFDQTLATR